MKLNVEAAIQPLRDAAPRDFGREDQTSAQMILVARDIDRGDYTLSDPPGTCLVGWAKHRGVNLIAG